MKTTIEHTVFIKSRCHGVELRVFFGQMKYRLLKMNNDVIEIPFATQRYFSHSIFKSFIRHIETTLQIPGNTETWGSR